MQLLEVQKEALTVGLADNKGIFKNLASIVKDAGLGQADDLFINPEDPESEQPQQEQPDPAMLEMQGKMQIEQQKLQLQAQKDQHAMQLAEQRLQWEMDLAERRMQAETQLALIKGAGQVEQPRAGGSLAA